MAAIELKESVDGRMQDSILGRIISEVTESRDSSQFTWLYDISN